MGMSEFSRGVLYATSGSLATIALLSSVQLNCGSVTTVDNSWADTLADCESGQTVIADGQGSWMCADPIAGPKGDKGDPGEPGSTPWLSAGTDIRYDGHVGLGTEPVRRLDVGPEGTMDEGAEIKLRGAGTFRDWGVDVYQADLRLFTTNPGSGAGYALRLLVQGDGNVGVGVDSPDERLHVGGNITATGAFMAGARIANCDYPTGAVFGDCSCGAGESVLSGGTVISNGAVRESRPIGTNTWRVACETHTGNRLDCGEIRVVCARLK